MMVSGMAPVLVVDMRVVVMVVGAVGLVIVVVLALVGIVCKVGNADGWECKVMGISLH